VKKIALGALAYTVSTFALAVVWHLVLFEDQYRAFGYIEGEPNILIGFVTILLQGAILSLLFPLLKLKGSHVIRGLKFAFLIGVFFWTSHVLAFVAKQSMQDVILFVGMETFYLALQFGMFGLLVGLIYRGNESS
jgi:hypothetical protein